MKKFLLLFAFLLLSYSTNILQAQSFCRTSSYTTNENVEIDPTLFKKTDIEYHLRLYIHVIRRSDGTGGQTRDDINTVLSYLAMDFNPHNIFFEWDCEIDYIDNDNYFNNPGGNIFSNNNHFDGIDIYLFDDSISGFGLANGVGSHSELLVTGSYWNPPYGSLVKSHVISHEMGHVLYLWHTHHGTFNEGGNDNPCPEFVDGSNCWICGDHVCDTPADPRIGFNVDPITCEWLGSGTDAHGDSYDPDEHIIMSYTSPDCMEYFTDGEGARMRGAIVTLDYLLATITDEAFAPCCNLNNLDILPNPEYTDICGGGVLCIYDVSTSPPVILSNTGYNVEVKWSTGATGQCMWWSGGSGQVSAYLTEYYGGWNEENIICQDTIVYNIVCNPCELKLKAKTSVCFDNDTKYYISDDYYYVKFSVAGTGGTAWDAFQYVDGVEIPLFSGVGDQVVALPQQFLIQDGSWVLIIRLNEDPDCAVKIEITPPEYCSGCHSDIKISNKKCYKSGWTFDILINAPIGPGPIIGGWFTSTPPGASGTYGVVQTIYVQGFDCIDFTIFDKNDKECFTKLTVCPPEPCNYDCAPKVDYSVSDCILTKEGFVYYVKAEITVDNDECWEAFRVKDGVQVSLGTFYGSQTQVFGPFPANEGVWELVIKYCNKDCSTTVKIKSPDCKKDDGGDKSLRQMKSNSEYSVKAFPNPLINSNLTIVGGKTTESFTIVDVNYQVYVKATKINGSVNIDFDYPPGVYFVIFKSNNNILKIKKLIKL